MSSSTAVPIGILREVFSGTGVSVSSDADSQDSARAVGLLSGARLASAVSSTTSLPWALGVTVFAGGALLLAVASLNVSWEGTEKLESFRNAAHASDAALAELPRLKRKVESVSAELDSESAAQQRLLEASDVTKEDVKAARVEIEHSIETTYRELRLALEAVKAQTSQLNARLEKVETDQTAQASTLQSLQLRMSTADTTAPAMLPLAAFHLLSVKDGVATVNGPDGLTSTSVGDTLSTLGKVLKIVGLGRNSVLVAEHGKLTISKHPVFKHTAKASGR